MKILASAFKDLLSSNLAPVDSCGMCEPVTSCKNEKIVNDFIKLSIIFDNIMLKMYTLSRKYRGQNDA